MRDVFLLPEQVICLVEEARKIRQPRYLSALILLGAEHGASRQESLSLRWSDIDFDYKGFGLIKFYRTKNERKRTEYLMPRTRAALLEWRDHLEWMRRRKRIEVVDDHVICRLNGTAIKRFDKAFRKVRDRARLPEFHFHDEMVPKIQTVC